MLRHADNSKGTPAAGSVSDAAPAGITATDVAADWLSLAATPTFAIMALLAGVLGGPADMLCSSAGDAPAITGMVPMYVLMSAFHSAPWLRLISGQRRPACRS